MEEMDVDTGSCYKEKVEEIQASLEVESDQYRQMVANAAKAFNITQHPDPAVTLQAIERRIAKIKALKMQPEAPKDKKKVEIVKLDNLATGVSSTSPQLNDALRILRLLHGVQIRECQTKINELIADVQKLTANPKCDLNLGRIGR